MIAALLVVLPIFALILLGWGAGRLRILGETASAELNKFVVWLAVPALLFEVIGKAKVDELSQTPFICAFGLSTGIVFAVAIAVGLQIKKPLGEAVIDSLNAAYSNIGYVGLPLMIMVLGRTSVIFTTLALLITMCLVFAVAIVLVEIADARGTAGEIGLGVSKTLVRNPILVASACALPFPIFGWSIPAPAQTFLDMLGAAASPCALVSLGLFLSQPRPSLANGRSYIGFLVVAKLAVHPALAWSIATYLFALAPSEVIAATMLAALPAGTGSFMLAGLYNRDPAVSSFAIIASTVLSVFTLSSLVALQPIG